MKRLFTFNSLLILCFLALLALLAGASTRTAQAATITVNTTDDENNTDGDCSLREAIIAANTDDPVDACPTGNGADTINLPAGTYILTLVGAGEDAALTGDLDIKEDLTIQGAGKTNTIISGNGLDRVLHIFSPTQISDVTISDGDAGTDQGGGIRVVSSLTLSNSRVKDNTANAGGGLQLSGSSAVLTVIESRIYNNTALQDGGGIYNFGTVTLLNSLISGNTASSGGGISSQHTVVGINSTFSGNIASNAGGGLKIVDTASLFNVTITENQAAQGGGVYNFGVLNAKNSIFSDNIDSSPGTANADCSGALTSLGYNLISDTSGCIINGTTGNITNVSANLGPLQNNGGPTLTHALLAGSPAIDAGEPVNCHDADGIALTTDQRGFARPVDGDGNGNIRCDMGAYEYGSPGQPTPTNTPTETTTSTITSTLTPTKTATLTNTPSPTGTDDPSPTATSTHTPSSTGTALTASPTWTSTPFLNLTSTPGPSPTVTATVALTPLPTQEGTPPSDGLIYLPMILR